MSADTQIKSDKNVPQPSEAEVQAAWEICNRIWGMLNNREKWEAQYEISDGELSTYIEALINLGVPLARIGDIAALIHQKMEPGASPERDPFALVGLWRLEFAQWCDDLDACPDFEKLKRNLASGYAGGSDGLSYWALPTILKERQERAERLAEYRAEQQAKAAADPYQRIWTDDRPLLLGYHDRHCLLPRYRDGGIGLIVGEKNHFKTTVTVLLLVEAMVADPDLDVVYLAGEQPGDVLNKVRHYGEAAGLMVNNIRARFHLRDQLPPLHKPENREEVLTAAERFRAGIVVVDTYQHAITGLDENSSKAAELSTNGGIFGQLKARGRLVLILGHPPADGSPRFRGNTGIEGAADFVITFRATHSKGSFKAEVINMRGTAAGAIAHATFPKVSPALTAGERLALPPPDIIWSTVREYNAVTHDPRPVAELAPTALPSTPSQAAVKRPMTRTEKATERKRRQRERERQGVTPDVTQEFIEPVTW
jgi:hypothetical protein